MDADPAHAHPDTDYGPDSHFPGDTYRVSVFDAGGRLVLNGHATSTLIEAISNLADGLVIRYGEPDLAYHAAGARELLPVRAQPQPLTHSVTHSHEHRHPSASAADRLRDAFDLTPGATVTVSAVHAHAHAHTGDDAQRATVYGHADDPHIDHAH
jgi:hypothetical protein